MIPGKKRQITKEDFAFDTDGTGAKVMVPNSDGSTREASALNAEHIPILAALRSELQGAANINDALAYLLNAFSSAGGNASTTKRGIVELATSEEVIAGLSGLLAVTPLALKSLTGTLERKGLVQFATTLEALAGTETSKAVSPATLEEKLTDSLNGAALDGIERGMLPKQSVTYPTREIDIFAGRRADSTYSHFISLDSVLSKRLDLDWYISESGGGAKPPNVAWTADTWYHIFVIYDPVNKLTNAGIDSNINATNLLAFAEGYTEYRRIGAVLTDASADIAYVENTTDRTILAFGAVSSLGAKLNGSNNWTVAKTGSGQYHLNITDSGDYVVVITAAGGGSHSSNYALHNTTTGYFENDISGNIRFRDRHEGLVGTDTDWTFYAIKL